MEKTCSTSSIHSISSESLNISHDECFPSNKEQSLTLCINEFNLIKKRLDGKCQALKRWEKELQHKEEKILSLCNSVNQYVACEVTSKSVQVIKDINERYCDLEKKYNSLNKDHKRLQRSFETIKTQNKSLRLEFDECLLSEESLRKDKEKLISKVAVLGSSNNQQMNIKGRSVAIQTIVVTDPCDNISSATQCDSERRLDAVMSFTSTLHKLWLQMFNMAIHDLLTLHLTDMVRPRQSFADICLLIIPMCIESLRANILTNVDSITSLSVRRRHINVMTQHIEMLYWSIIYMDIGRISLRPGMMSPLTRIGEDLALILVSKTSSSPSLKKMIIGDNEAHSLTILLALRTVNQTDILSLVLQYLLLLQKNTHMSSVLLAKCLYVPLLCRWTSTATCYAFLYPKVLTIVIESLHHPIDYHNEKCSVSLVGSGPIKLFDSGLSQLSFLITRLSLCMTEANKPSCSHPLVFLLDILHTSKDSERDFIVTIIGTLIHTKRIRAMSRDLGLVSIVSNLISQYTSSGSSCLTNLRSILAEITL